MPTTTTKTKTTKKTGKGLSKKLGPFPTYVWLALGVVILGYLYYRHRQSSGTALAAGGMNQTLTPSNVYVPAQSAGTTSGSDTGSGSDSPNTFPTDYATQTDLQNAIDTIDNNTAGAIAAITFPQPNINITSPPAVVQQTTTASKTAAKKAATATAPKKITYYSYKKNVPLKAGQTIHYTAKKGYYAA